MPDYYDVLYSSLPVDFDPLVFDISKGDLTKKDTIENGEISIAKTYHYLNIVKELNELRYVYEKIKKDK